MNVNIKISSAKAFFVQIGVSFMYLINAVFSVSVKDYSTCLILILQ
jgi:hypothetical protein